MTENGHTSTIMTIQTPPSQPFLTQQQLAQRWHVTIMTLWRMRRDNKLKSYRIGERGVRFAIEDILKLENQSVS